MCGIFFSAITRHQKHAPDHDENGENASSVRAESGLNDILLHRLSCRGPDSNHTVYARCSPASSLMILDDSSASNPEQSKHIDLTFHSTVLSLRGPVITPQPATDPSSGNILCWNGEAWSIGKKSLEYGESDTDVVFQLLQNASSHVQIQSEKADGHDDGPNAIIEALMTIQGPFAFVYYHAAFQRLYFGRDCRGRRSLLYKSDSADGASLMLASVGDGLSGWDEVPADGVYVVDLSKIASLNATKDQTSEVEPDTNEADNKKGLLHLPSVNIRCHSYAFFNKYSPHNHVPPSPPQRRLTIHSPAVTELETLLLSALDIRVRTIPGLQQPLAPASDTTQPQQPRIALLFSGGLDCTTLARLLHTLLPVHHSIDLLNVAFHNPHIHKTTTPTPKTYASCPDRITALKSVTELRQVCPEREWRLVEIDVPFEEAMRERELVAELMRPRGSEMDVSIALALFFAARGKGVVRNHVTTNSDGLSAEEAEGKETEYMYTTPARILLSGLGADELFGGYSRHATAFARNGFAGLTAELELDVARLGSRNLGRDDRVVSHWGREVRYPFLDEDVVSWAVSRGVGEICGFGMVPECDEGTEGGERKEREEGSGELEPGKLVLRLLTYKLGMKQVAREKKRAIQFGARTAKMMGGGRRGDDAFV